MSTDYPFCIVEATNPEQFQRKVKKLSVIVKLLRREVRQPTRIASQSHAGKLKLERNFRPAKHIRFNLKGYLSFCHESIGL